MPLMTDVELTKHLQLPLETMHELRRRHGWPCVRLGRFHYRFTDDQVEQIIREHTEAPQRTRDPPAVTVWGQTPLSAARRRR